MNQAYYLQSAMFTSGIIAELFSTVGYMIIKCPLIKGRELALPAHT